MDVVLVSFYYDKNFYCGANKRFDETGKFLKKNGYRLKVAVPKGHVPNWCDDDEAVEFDTTSPGPLRRIELFLKFQAWLKRIPKSIVISDFMPVPARALKKHVHFQLVHDLRNFTGFHRAKFPIISRKWQARQWRKSQKMLTVSSFTRQQLNRFCGIPEENVIVSHNGIDPTYLERDTNGKRTVDFLYIAHFEPRKNHPMLIRALIELKKQGIEANTLLLAKKDETRGEVQKLIEDHSLANTVRIDDGSFTEQELIAMYLNSKVFVTPAKYEGFGMPIIEAMASGCRICCSDIEVFHEVAGKNALYFDPDDAKDIAENLNRSLHQDVDRAELRNLVEKAFTWDQTLQPIREQIEKFSKQA